MKIIKEKGSRKLKLINLRISEDTIKKIDKIAEENSISRQKLIEAILDQAINDRKFIIKIY